MLKMRNSVLLATGLVALLQMTVGVIVEEGPRNVAANIGNTVQLSCRVRELLPRENIVWRHVDSTSSSYLTVGLSIFTTDPRKRSRYSVITQDYIDGAGNSVYIFNLQMIDLQVIDQGEYICGYIRNNGEFDDFGMTAKARVTVLLLPICGVNYFGRRSRPRAGEVVNLQCSVNGDQMPVPTYKWSAPSRIIDQSRFSPPTTRSLTRLTIQDSDENLVFTCNATTEFQSASCEVVPFPQPPDVRLIQIGTFAEGENVTFICDAIGQQPMTYSWTRVGLNVLVEQRFSREENDKILHIFDIKEEDNNTAVECEASYIALDMSNSASQLLHCKK